MSKEQMVGLHPDVEFELTEQVPEEAVGYDPNLAALAEEDYNTEIWFLNEIDESVGPVSAEYSSSSRGADLDFFRDQYQDIDYDYSLDD